MHYFFLGVLPTQFTYITVQWLQLRYKEYLLYGWYIGTFTLYVAVIFQSDLLPLSPGSEAYIIIDSMKRPLALLLYYEYFLFGQYFIDLQTRFPSIYKRLQPLGKIILSFMGIQMIVQLLGPRYHIINDIAYYSFCIFLFFVFVVFIFKLWNTDDRLIRYVLQASTCVSVGGFLSNLLVILSRTHLVGDSYGQYFYLPFCLGAAFEIYFFNTGIVYKVSMAEKKLIVTQQQLIAKLSENEKLLITQQQIRNKLAQDLHDDIGATLSGIALHSHMVKEQISQNKTESVLRSLNLIENGAVEMVNNLNEVVWTVNPKNDTAEETFERLKEYCFSITQAKEISVAWKINDEQTKNIRLPMELRRNIYLICKEAINNAVKYSGCRKITVSGDYTSAELQLSIADDGNGFDIHDLSKGNGLKNMRERARESHIQLDLESSAGRGTVISLHYRITQ